MTSSKKLDSRFVETNTASSRYLKRVDTGLVMTTISNGYFCYNVSTNRVIGVNEEEQFFILDSSNGSIEVFSEPIIDFEDLGDGLVQLMYQTHCAIVDTIDKIFIAHKCADLEKSQDPTSLVVHTDDSVLIVDRTTRLIKFKTAKV
jgi:hypothetical protein